MRIRNAAAALFLALCCTGCAYKVVRPPALVVEASEAGGAKTINYPPYVVVHDSSSFWDAHQLKDNLVGLYQAELVHWCDRALDSVTPGPPRLPVRTCVDWTANRYARLPDCGPVRVVRGFFDALGIEKTTFVQSGEIAAAPASPVAYFVFTRVVYLTDWGQETLGEVNAAAGKVAPWPGRFVPQVATAPLNGGVDWAQSGAITLYLYALHQLNIGADHVIEGAEVAWVRVIQACARGPLAPEATADAEPEFQSARDCAP